MRRQLDVLGVTAVAFDADIAAAVKTQRLELRQAVAAMAAEQIEMSGDGVAQFQAGDAGAERDDLSRDLVTDDAREAGLAPPGFDVLDGEPGAAGDDARHRLAGTGRRIRH